jgi:small subunit ribosomal protein S4
MVTHGHFAVNDKKTNVPSMLLKKGDRLAFRGKSSGHEEYKAIVESHKSKEVPSWLTVDREKMEISIVDFPRREDVTVPIEEHLIVELYSK